MEAIGPSETTVDTRTTGATSQKTAFFIVTAVKTSNLNNLNIVNKSIEELIYFRTIVFFSPVTLQPNFGLWPPT
jgi:hypothetical protein